MTPVPATCLFLLLSAPLFLAPTLYPGGGPIMSSLFGIQITRNQAWCVEW